VEILPQIQGPRLGGAGDTGDHNAMDYLASTGTASGLILVPKYAARLRYDLDGVSYTDTLSVGMPVRPWIGTPASSEAAPWAPMDTSACSWVLFSLPAGGGVARLYALQEELYAAIRDDDSGGHNFHREDEPGCPGSGEPVFLPLEVIGMGRNVRYQLPRRTQQDPVPFGGRDVYLLTGTSSGGGQYGYEYNSTLPYPQYGGAVNPTAFGCGEFMLALPQMRLAVSPQGDTLSIAQDGSLWFCTPGIASPGVRVTLPQSVPNQTETRPIAVIWDGSFRVLSEATDRHASASGHGFAYLYREVLAHTASYTPGVAPVSFASSVVYANDRTPGVRNIDTDTDFLNGKDFNARFPAHAYPRAAELMAPSDGNVWVVPHFDGAAKLDGYILGACRVIMPDGTDMVVPQQYAALPPPANQVVIRAENDGPNIAFTNYNWYTNYEVWLQYDGSLRHREVTVPYVPTYLYPDSNLYPVLPPYGDYLLGKMFIQGAGLPWGSDQFHGNVPGPNTQSWTGMPDLNGLAYGYLDHGNPFPLGPTHALQFFLQYAGYYADQNTPEQSSSTIFYDNNDGTVGIYNGYYEVPFIGHPLHGYPSPKDVGHEVNGWWWANGQGIATEVYQGVYPIGGFATGDPDTGAYALGTPSLGADPFHPMRATMATVDTENYGVSFRTFGFTGAARIFYDGGTDLYGGYVPVNPSDWPGYEHYTVPVHPQADFNFRHVPTLTQYGSGGTSSNGMPRVPLDPDGLMRESVYGGFTPVNLKFRVKGQSRFGHTYAAYRVPAMRYAPQTLRTLADLCVLTYGGEICYDGDTRTWTNVASTMATTMSARLGTLLGTPSAIGSVVQVRQSGPGQPVLCGVAILMAGVLYEDFPFSACLSLGNGDIHAVDGSTGNIMLYSVRVSYGVNSIPVASFATEPPHGTPITAISSVGRVTTTTVTTYYIDSNTLGNLLGYYSTTVSGWTLLVANAVPVGDEITTFSYSGGTWHVVHGSSGTLSATSVATPAGSVALSGLPVTFRFPTNEAGNINTFTASGLAGYG